MILKALLRKVVRYVAENPTEHGCAYILKCVELTNMTSQTQRTTEQFIMELDPRDIGVLRDYVPMAFPKHLRQPIELDVHQNNLGAWRVDPKQRETVNG